MQELIAYLIVAAAALYAAWLFMPQAMRHRLIGRMMILAPSKQAWLARVEADGENAGCRTCKGCATDENPAPAPEPAKIKIHRRAAN
jgi:hypothetical protein